MSGCDNKQSRYSKLSYREVSEAGRTDWTMVRLTKVYPGHLTHLTTLQVQVVVKGALGTGPGAPSLLRWRGWHCRCEVVLKLNTCLSQRN